MHGLIVTVAALVSCHCLINVAVVIVLGLLFLLFFLLSSQRVSRHSCETLRELLLDSRQLQGEILRDSCSKGG